MNMLKTKVSIKGIEFEVIFEDPRHTLEESFTEDDCGDTVFNKSKIFINSTLNTDLMARTIKHELTHAFAWAFGMGQVKWNEEVVCDFMETHGEDIISMSKTVFNEYIIMKQKKNKEGK